MSLAIQKCILFLEGTKDNGISLYCFEEMNLLVSPNNLKVGFLCPELVFLFVCLFLLGSNWFWCGERYQLAVGLFLLSSCCI